ncbi:MAG: Anti-sigma-28 factor, FlgM [Planctomycetota bacterium]|jgi:negative regulator of flagellin synthesis FlgM
MANLGNINGGSHSVSTYGPGIAQGVRSTSDAAARRTDSTTATTNTRASDRVEVSQVARWLEEMNRLPAVRENKVAAARAAIANGTLDSDEKLAIAVSRMIDEIG